MSVAQSGNARHFPNSPPFTTGLIGLLVFLLCFFFWSRGIAGSPTADFHLFLAVISGVMILVDVLIFRVHRQPEVGIDWSGLAVSDIQITQALFPKIAAAALMAGLTVLFYQTIDLYQDDWYRRFTGILLAYALPISAVLLVYIVGVDMLTQGREDGLSNLGVLVLSLGKRGNRRLAADFALGWLVKLFFLPLMYGYALDDWLFFYGPGTTIDSFRAFYEFMYRFIFFTDVIFAIIGYCIALRLLNSQVRQPERTFSGWFICLMCYMPFWQVFGRSYFNFNGDFVWGPIFEPFPVLYVLWASIILIALCCYLASTLAFGLRFSNLTYRGVVYRGTYSLTKHPAYLSKNLTMWMISLPFLAASPEASLSNVLALIGVNLIYYIRARHEETCCRSGRDYQIYERFIRRHGAVARIRAAGGRWVGGLQNQAALLRE